MPEASSVDSERPREGKPFDAAADFSGQDYAREREAALGAERPSGSEDAIVTGGNPARPEGRAHFDARTGEVHEQGLAEGETGSE